MKVSQWYVIKIGPASLKAGRIAVVCSKIGQAKRLAKAFNREFVKDPDCKDMFAWVEPRLFEPDELEELTGLQL